ncbi:hypothetical protein [Bacillus taeanensis]|uniref:Uncharacterized protein n=1 Tax=Bacillus taeanensis TaxID=273032 RepID=A0A366XSJ7_9BACI|nr:hypothetical protein [Bacillus taeanensis]RBW68857.1 hypothetical protein DS031_14050 [Bacillus taeanensis]
MDYLTQLKKFYDWMETNPLPPSVPAVVLWHALMYLVVKNGGAPEFSVGTHFLMGKTGECELMIRRARQELKNLGFIDFIIQPGNQADIYYMRDLAEVFENGKLENNICRESVLNNKRKNHNVIYLHDHLQKL